MAKEHKGDYGNYILNNKENILRKKKNIIRMKRTILVLIVLFTILITLGLTLPDFNLKEVKVSGLEMIPEDSIISTVALETGTNIFKINTKKIENVLKKNTYIDSVQVKRKMPNKISIEVKERKVAFYIQGAEGNYVIDKNGRVLGKKETIEDPNVLRIDGIVEENIVIGELLQGEELRRFEGVQNIYEFLVEKGFFEQYSISRLEIKDFVDFKLYVNQAYLKLGTSENMSEKLAKGFSILSAPEFVDFKGYVDVSFDGNPVVFREK